MLGLENSLSLKDSYQFPLNGCLLEDMETFSREGSSDSSRKPLLWDFQREMLVAVGLVQGRKYILPNTMGIAGVVFTVEHPENPIIYDGSGKQVVRMTLVPGGGPGIAWKVHIQDEMGKPLLGARAVLLSGGVGIADRAVVRGDRPVELWVDPTRKPKCQVECGEYYPATAEYDGNSSTVRLRRLPAIRLQCNLTGRSVIEYALFSCRGCIALKDNIGGADAPDRLVGYVPPGDYVLVVLRRDQPLESAETYFTSVSAVDVLAMRITDGDRTVKASFVGNSREHCQLKGRILAPGSGAFSVGQINGVMFRYPSAVVRAGNLAEVVCRDKVPPDYLIAREPLEGAKPDKKWKGADIVFRHQDEWTYILVTAPSAQTQPHTGRAAQ